MSANDGEGLIKMCMVECKMRYHFLISCDELLELVNYKKNEVRYDKFFFSGTQNFQLSEKLYTRYSAVAVQTGCPFLESLNEVYVS